MENQDGIHNLPVSVHGPVSEAEAVHEEEEQQLQASQEDQPLHQPLPIQHPQPGTAATTTEQHQPPLTALSEEESESQTSNTPPSSVSPPPDIDSEPAQEDLHESSADACGVEDNDADDEGEESSAAEEEDETDADAPDAEEAALQQTPTKARREQWGTKQLPPLHPLWKWRARVLSPPRAEGFRRSAGWQARRRRRRTLRRRLAMERAMIERVELSLSFPVPVEEWGPALVDQLNRGFGEGPGEEPSREGRCSDCSFADTTRSTIVTAVTRLLHSPIVHISPVAIS